MVCSYELDKKQINILIIKKPDDDECKKVLYQIL